MEFVIFILAGLVVFGLGMLLYVNDAERHCGPARFLTGEWRNRVETLELFLP